jgi:redox-sensitive bicupin YhaK (pirin superfamily)
MSIIKHVLKSNEVKEGAGVLVNRAFGYYEVKMMDPFLMLDYFEDNGESPGIPWHPHAGIETITYMIKGNGKHEDTLGNSQIIESGELQWMSTGKGLYHQEMPVDNKGSEGFQFWVNQTEEKKKTEPFYDFIGKGEMPVKKTDGYQVRVVSGSFDDIVGPIDKSEFGINMYHVSVYAGYKIDLKRTNGKNGFIFVFKGSGSLNGEELNVKHTYVLDVGDLSIQANSDLEIIFAEGIPLNEDVHWHGPIVMSNRRDLEKVFASLNDGTFPNY